MSNYLRLLSIFNNAFCKDISTKWYGLNITSINAFYIDQ